MRIKHFDSESRLLGKPVIKIEDWNETGEIFKAESELRNKNESLYLFCEVDATDLNSIHELEKEGYLFSEFRVNSILATGQVHLSTRSFYPYVAELISDEAQLEEAVNILMDSNGDDRFSNDPAIGEKISQKRTVDNLRKSFLSWPSEFLLGIFNVQTKELVAFRSGAFLSAREAHYYQYGVSKFRDFNHTADMLEVFTIDFLKQRDIQVIHAVSTGFNIAELNRLIKIYGFVIRSSSVILRKHYPISSVV